MKFCILTMMTFLISDFSFSGSANQRIILSWELGYHATPGTEPSAWIPAAVPGAVQLDVAKAKKYQPYYYAENWRDYLWMEDQYYTYRTSFGKLDLSGGKRLLFISLGIDYQFEIWLNGEKLFYQEGMFTPVKLDLTDQVRDRNVLEVKIYPVPKRHPSPADRTQADHVVKPAVSYGWDWHPRLIPLGIWDDTFLEIRPAAFVDDVQLNYNLDETCSKADINLALTGTHLTGCRYQWVLADDSGNEVLKIQDQFTDNQVSHMFTLPGPVLWWPHDQGKPYLYTSTLQLFDPSGKLIQSESRKTGFRRIRLVMNEGAWSEPVGFPKTRSVPPVQFEVNGRKIFCKGTNWVNPEIFPGIITRERYNELLDRAIEVHFNILRVWGGGIVNKESFFELCDEKGILVWQEFPLACNNYEGTPRYLSILEQESASIISRVKKHPSLALWCGGNELFNSWSGMTDQSLALRLLASQCYKLDPQTPFLPTSPVMGMGHGHYIFRDAETGEEVFQEMVRARCTAYTEFGMPSPASVDILKTIIPESELWPPRPGTSWESHHAYKAWGADTWLCQDIIESYFGPSASLEVLVANGQLMQGEGYKCIYEEARRQKPYCSLATNWCYNEPWPTAANNSLLSYPAVPKPGFYAVKNACRPVLASARLPKFRWTGGETFHAQMWMLSDLPAEVNAGKVTLKLACGTEMIEVDSWSFKAMPANTNQSGPEISFQLPDWKTDRFKVLLEVEGHPEYNSEYIMAFSKNNTIKTK